METNVEQNAVGDGAVSLTFGQIEAVLADIHAIAVDKRVAFTGRLKALQRNGLPVGMRPGRGKAASFNYLQFMQLAIGMELMQAGIAPAPAASIITANWPILRHSIGYAFNWLLKDDADEAAVAKRRSQLDLSWLVDVRDFASLMRPRFRNTSEIGSIEPVNSKILANAMSYPEYNPRSGRRHTEIHIHAASLILATYREITDRRYARGGDILFEILDHSTMPEGLGTATPPWSAKATAFFETSISEEAIKDVADDFLAEAPRNLIDSFIALARADMRLDKLDNSQFREALNLYAWGLVDVPDEDNQPYELTRAGKLAFQALMGSGYVYPQA